MSSLEKIVAQDSDRAAEEDAGKYGFESASSRNRLENLTKETRPIEPWPLAPPCEPTTQNEEVGPVRTLSRTRIVLLAISMMLTYFLGTASSTAVTLVIPAMAADLHTSELNAQWVASAYSIAYGCGLLFSGRIADMYGRKFLYLMGMGVFLVFSIISANVRIRVALCVVRAFAGLGLAIASPAGYGIVGTNIRTEPERSIVFAAFGLGGPIGAATGTILGGAVAGVGSNGWTCLFYIMAGATLLPLVIGFFVVPRDTRSLRGDDIDRRIDWLGGFLVTAATTLFTFSIVQSGAVEDGWSTPYVPALLAVSIILVTIFLLWEGYLERHTTFPPIVKPSLFSRYRYKSLAVILCAFAAACGCYGWVYVTTIWYQNYLGYSALNNAIHVLPANVGGLVAAGLTMFLAPRVRAPILLSVGGILSGITCLLFAVEPKGTKYWACEFIANLILPYGIDFAVCIGNILMSNLVEQDEQSVGGALFQTSVQLGGAFGICLSSLIVTQQHQSTGDLLAALRNAMWMNAAWSWLVPVIVVFALRKVRLAKDVAKDV